MKNKSTKTFAVTTAAGELVGTGRKVVVRKVATYHDAHTETVIKDRDGLIIAWQLADGSWDTDGSPAVVTEVVGRKPTIINLATADLDALLGA